MTMRARDEGWPQERRIPRRLQEYVDFFTATRLFW